MPHPPYLLPTPCTACTPLPTLRSPFGPPPWPHPPPNFSPAFAPKSHVHLFGTWKPGKHTNRNCTARQRGGRFHLAEDRSGACGAKVLVKKALPATRSCLTQTGSSGTQAFVHTIFDRLRSHLHIIHKCEHNINITCLFALAEKQFVMRALAE